MMLETVHTSETSSKFYNIIWHHISEECYLQHTSNLKLVNNNSPVLLLCFTCRYELHILRNILQYDLTFCRAIIYLYSN
jgi:hypothetical protein